MNSGIIAGTPAPQAPQGAGCSDDPSEQASPTPSASVSFSTGLLPVFFASTKILVFVSTPSFRPTLATIMVALGFEVVLGFLTFTGSLIAAGKLQGIVRDRPWVYRGQNLVNLSILASALVMVGFLVDDPSRTFLFPIIIGLGVQAQPNRTNTRQVGNMLQRLERSSSRFRNSLNVALVQRSVDQTQPENDISTFQAGFDLAIKQFRDQFTRRLAVASDVESILQNASPINSFITQHTLNPRVKNDWASVRTNGQHCARI